MNHTFAATADSQQQLTAILNALPDTVITFSGDGIITHVNRAAGKLLGYEQNELPGRQLLQVVSLPHQQDLNSILRTLVTTPRQPDTPVYRCETTAHTLSGDQIAIALSITQVDHLDKFTAIMRDIRKIRALQREVLSATEFERSRISQELHDRLGQDLVGLSMLAKGLATEFKAGTGNSNELVDRLVTISRQLDQCVRDLREIIFDLAPLDLSQDGLILALQKLVDSVSKSHQVVCQLNIYGNQQNSLLDANSENNIQLLRIAREAVHNALKHAQARHIHIMLKADNGIQLDIVDDGKGISTDQIADPQCQGIRIMTYRAKIMGGDLLVKPNLPTGTCVACVIPRVTHNRNQGETLP